MTIITNRMAKRRIIPNVGENVEIIDLSYITVGNINRFSCCGKQFGASPKDWT